MQQITNADDIAKKYNMLSVDEVDLIKSCVGRLPRHPKIINIGANVGTSTCAMLEANKNAFIFSLDKNPCFEERANLTKCGLPVRQVVRILGDSTKIDTSLWPFRVDMVFIDGGHTVEDVTADFNNWNPFVKQIVLFHDYNHPNYTKNGVNKFDDAVDSLVNGWDKIGQARYLVAFERI